MALYVVTMRGLDGSNGDRKYPVEALGAFAAMMTVQKLAPNAPNEWFSVVGPIVSCTHDEWDCMTEDVERWFGECCDYAYGNDNVSDAEWDEILDIEDRTTRALCNVSTF